MTSTTVNVSGMTCGHCVSAVRGELEGLPGVTVVDVELVAGGVSPVTITSDGPLEADAVAAAIDEAGYAVATAGRTSLPLVQDR